MELKGLHHVSAITAKAGNNFEFYTKVLGMRLIKKTVNQDDVRVYHLFYGDQIGSPGTELTFFEIPNAARTHEGNNSISEISLRVRDDEALGYWKKGLLNSMLSMMKYRAVLKGRCYLLKILKGRGFFWFPIRIITGFKEDYRGMEARYRKSFQSLD